MQRFIALTLFKAEQTSVVVKAQKVSANEQFSFKHNMPIFGASPFFKLENNYLKKN